MSEMEEYSLRYQCKRCGGRFSGLYFTERKDERISATTRLMDVLFGIKTERLGDPKYLEREVHICEDEHFGVGELIGIERTEE